MKNNISDSVDKVNLPNDLKTTPFSIPDGYLENINAELSGKLNKETNTRTIDITKPYLSIAAIIVGVFLVWSILLRIYTTDSQPPIIQTMATNQMTTEEQYLEYIDESVMVEAFHNNDKNETYTASLVSIETNTLIEYLSDDDIDDIMDFF